MIVVGTLIGLEILFYALFFQYNELYINIILNVFILAFYLPFQCRYQYLRYRKILYLAFIIYCALSWMLLALKLYAHVAIYYWVEVLDTTKQPIIDDVANNSEKIEFDLATY